MDVSRPCDVPVRNNDDNCDVPLLAFSQMAIKFCDSPVNIIRIISAPEQ